MRANNSYLVAAVSPSAPAAPSSVSGSASPRIDAPTRSSAARPAADARSASVPGDAKPAGRQSLWNGLVQPLAMTASDAAQSGDADSASANAGRDYETHILGMKSAPARGALASNSTAASSSPNAPASSARQAGGKIFVSLALDPKEAGSLRDAVAGLGASAGFSADARFEATPGPNGTVLYSGWIPAERLADALKRPGVKSLRVETRAAGFHLTRVIGLETAPDGRAVAVVSGTLPLSRLSRAMGLFEVAKIVPVGGEIPAPAPAVPAGPGGVSGFANFAVQHGPWLIILTLLLPSLRAPARRLASVFNPYR